MRHSKESCTEGRGKLVSRNGPSRQTPVFESITQFPFLVFIKTLRTLYAEFISGVLQLDCQNRAGPHAWEGKS